MNKGLRTVGLVVIAGSALAAAAAVGFTLGRLPAEQLPAWARPPLPAAPAALALHQQMVLDRLNDPDSAQFRGGHRSPIDPSVWCGEVNARNRMGGMVGFTRYVVYESQIESRPELGQVFFDPRSGYAESTSDGAAFISKWVMLCDDS